MHKFVISQPPLSKPWPILIYKVVLERAALRGGGMCDGEDNS